MDTTTSTYRRIGNSRAIIVPRDLGEDSAFPFSEGDTIRLTIQKDKIILSKE